MLSIQAGKKKGGKQRNKPYQLQRENVYKDSKDNNNTMIPSKKMKMIKISFICHVDKK